jgi:hypothetical protein
MSVYKWCSTTHLNHTVHSLCIEHIHFHWVLRKFSGCSEQPSLEHESVLPTTQGCTVATPTQWWKCRCIGGGQFTLFPIVKDEFCITSLINNTKSFQQIQISEYRKNKWSLKQEGVPFCFYFSHCHRHNWDFFSKGWQPDDLLTNLFKLYKMILTDYLRAFTMEEAFKNIIF